MAKAKPITITGPASGVSALGETITSTGYNQTPKTANELLKLGQAAELRDNVSTLKKAQNQAIQRNVTAFTAWVEQDRVLTTSSPAGKRFGFFSHRDDEKYGRFGKVMNNKIRHRFNVQVQDLIATAQQEVDGTDRSTSDIYAEKRKAGGADEYHKKIVEQLKTKPTELKAALLNSLVPVGKDGKPVKDSFEAYARHVHTHVPDALRTAKTVMTRAKNDQQILDVLVDEGKISAKEQAEAQRWINTVEYLKQQEGNVDAMLAGPEFGEYLEAVTEGHLIETALRHNNDQIQGLNAAIKPFKASSFQNPHKNFSASVTNASFYSKYDWIANTASGHLMCIAYDKDGTAASIALPPNSKASMADLAAEFVNRGILESKLKKGEVPVTNAKSIEDRAALRLAFKMLGVNTVDRRVKLDRENQNGTHTLSAPEVHLRGERDDNAMHQKEAEQFCDLLFKNGKLSLEKFDRIPAEERKEILETLTKELRDATGLLGLDKEGVLDKKKVKKYFQENPHQLDAFLEKSTTLHSVSARQTGCDVKLAEAKAVKEAEANPDKGMKIKTSSNQPQ